MRRLGELMEVMPKAKPPGGSKKYPKKDRVVSGPDPLLDLGIDKHLADRARKAAAMGASGIALGNGDADDFAPVELLPFGIVEQPTQAHPTSS